MRQLEKEPIKGRGAQINPNGHYSDTQRNVEYLRFDDEEALKQTHYRLYEAKSLINEVKSPDIRFGYSMNVYQGCEHGCTYCYARNSHAYHDLGTGLDFERMILVKRNAPQLLEAFLNRKSWEASTIMMSGNTDCYQPLESKLGLTRQCLEIFLQGRHPVGIITKNALIKRDKDILQALAQQDLVSIFFSITSLDEDLRRKMEPRTSTTSQKLSLIEDFTNAGIPCSVMMAPIIPALNSHEIFEIAKSAAEAGAVSFHHSMVRLNGDVAEIFSDWIKKVYPDKAAHVLNGIRSLHNGQLNNSEYHSRMRGSGEIAGNIHQMVELARNKYFKQRERIPLRTDLHIKNGQLSLF